MFVTAVCFLFLLYTERYLLSHYALSHWSIGVKMRICDVSDLRDFPE